MHAWRRLASKRMSLSSRRDELVRLLCQYADHTGHKVTVVFDGYRLKHQPEILEPTRGVEVLFSERGKTADESIERMAGQVAGRQRVLVVSSDRMVRHTVESFGAQTASAEAFEAEVNSALAELACSIRRHRASHKFRQGFGSHKPDRE
jgi:predicted RNA-binding protein with PIN domain